MTDTLDLDKQTLRHSFVEDAMGILIGTFVASFGLVLLRSADAVTGGTAGLGLLVTYATDWPFGVVFFLVNAPFFALALWKKGLVFTLKSALSVALVSSWSFLHSFVFGDFALPTVYAVAVGNLLIGIGLLIIFRHGSSLGGFSIVALIAQEQFGWRAGYVQMSLDVAVVLAAFAVVSPVEVVLSAAGAVLLNVVLAMNHKPGRYTGW